MKLLVLQHGLWEAPGKLLQTAAKKNRVNLKVSKVWQERIPSIDGYDGLLVLGGAANVHQEKRYPFLVEEKKFIRKVLATDKPYLGFCLGHQLLADALGAKVGPNFRASIGFIHGHLTHEGREHPAFKGFQKKFPLFKWHGQTVTEPLPKHLSVLATSSQCQVEALSVIERPHILGVQFDNHAADPADVETWLEQDKKWIASFADQEVDSNKIRTDAKTFASRTAKDFHQLFANYVKLIRQK